MIYRLDRVVGQYRQCRSRHHNKLSICKIYLLHQFSIMQAKPFGVGGYKRKEMTILMRLLRSEEHTSELQSQSNLVCRLLLEKKKIKKNEKLQNLQNLN